MKYSKYKKGQIAVSTILGFASFAGSVAAPLLYFGDFKAETKEEFATHTQQIKTLEAAVGDIPSMKNDISQSKTDSAVTRALLENLSTDRFDYNPRPSQIKALERLSTSTE